MQPLTMYHRQSVWVRFPVPALLAGAALLLWSGLASATTITQIPTGAPPASAQTLMGQWGTILVTYALPLVAIGAGIYTMLHAIADRNGSGIVGGVVTAVLGVIGIMVLPTLITESATAAGFTSLTPAPGTLSPWLFVTYWLVRRLRHGRR